MHCSYRSADNPVQFCATVVGSRMRVPQVPAVPGSNLSHRAARLDNKNILLRFCANGEYHTLVIFLVTNILFSLIEFL